MTYIDPAWRSHPVITRTYNITSLIDGLIGVNKFDFGVWAHNPTHGGDRDYIVARFDKIEIMYNTSEKYEIGTLEFDYRAIDPNGWTSGTGDLQSTLDLSEWAQFDAMLILAPDVGDDTLSGIAKDTWPFWSCSTATCT